MRNSGRTFTQETYKKYVGDYKPKCDPQVEFEFVILCSYDDGTVCFRKKFTSVGYLLNWYDSQNERINAMYHYPWWNIYFVYKGEYNFMPYYLYLGGTTNYRLELIKKWVLTKFNISLK